MHKSHRTVSALFAVAAVVVAAGFFLVPSHKEIALMQMNDFDFNVAFKNFSALHSEGDTSINVLAPLVNLNAYYGDIDKAIELLAAFTAEHPSSLEGRKRLAELYKSSERYDHYCATLEEMQKLQPSIATLRELADIYAFLGRNRDEMLTLARLVEAKGYQPVEDDYYKLASFYRIDHQPEEAVGVIRNFISDTNYKVGRETVYLGVQLLQEQDKESKALDLAQTYLRKQGKEEDAIILSSLFEGHGQYESAYAVLEPYLENIGKSTELEQQVVDIMLLQKKDDDVYTMLSTQRASQGSLPPSLAVTMTDLAVARNDFEVIEALIRTQDLEKLPEGALLRYADFSFRQKRPDLAQVMLTKLSKEYQRASPALAAILQVAADDTPKNVAALANIPKDISPEAKIVLSALYMSHNMPQQAFGLLDKLPVADVLESFDAAQYAEIYLDIGAAAKAEQILNDARPNMGPEAQDSIDKILVLLAAGEGKTDYVKKKLEGYQASASDIWPDCFDFALFFHHDDTALVIAELTYKIQPTVPNRLQLAEALLINHRYSEVLNHLEALAAKNDEARAMYLDVIATWGQEGGGIASLSPSQRAGLNAAVASAIKAPNMSEDERRDLAYVLEDIGMYDQAETVLVALAGNAPFGTPDVEDLLGFWEDHPSDNSVGWVITRARKASGDDQVAWLVYLNDNNHPQAVLDVLHDGSGLSNALADQYIEALIETQNEGENKDRLAVYLEETIEAETNTDRLRKLTIIADEEDAGAAPEKGWRKLYAIDNNDVEAIKALGLLDYDNGNYEEALVFLSRIIDQNQSDYRYDYAYAEILQQQERKTEAEPHYRRALQLLSVINDKDSATRLDEAYLLYRTDHITESLALFRQLYAKYPGDKELRADFAEVLTEIGRFEEASALLSQQ